MASCSNPIKASLPQQTLTPLPLDSAETTLPSPDGKWRAYFFGYDLTQFRLSVENIDKTIIWNINQANFGHEALFSPYRWSQDGRYLYFNIHAAIDGYVPFYDGMGLRRLDVMTGKVSEILPSGDIASYGKVTIYDWDLAVFSLAPNDEYLAYINHVDNGVQLVIRDLETGAEKSLFFDEYSGAGSILWSPQQDRLVLAFTKGTNWSSTLAAIGIIDVDNLTSKVLIQDEERILDPVEWKNSSTILVKKRGGDFFYLDITTRKLDVAPTATSFPN